MNQNEQSGKAENPENEEKKPDEKGSSGDDSKGEGKKPGEGGEDESQKPVFTITAIVVKEEEQPDEKESSGNDSKGESHKSDEEKKNGPKNPPVHKKPTFTITATVVKEEKKSDEESSEDDSKDGGEKKDGKDKKKDEPKKPPIYKKPAFIITAIVVGVLLIVGGIILWLILRQFVSTDDAYVDGNVTQVSPQISAQIVALHIQDNQLVHQGDLLLELDPTDYQIALNQAQAQIASAQGKLEQARAQISVAKADIGEADAEVQAAQVAFDNARRDSKRYHEVDERARSGEQLDNATTAEKNAAAQLAQANAKKTSALANVTSAEASVKASEGDVKTSEANEKRAEVNLSYCKIISLVDGRVTQRTCDVGNYVVPGQALFLLVDPNVWVTANFKETQLQNMRPGQPVMIKVDAFPGMKWHGHVDSIQAGSGSRFGVLPAENATGNYVKIVQRVPVKILFEHEANTNDAPMLSPGLSVVPRVTVR
jgi:membrane fusion protein (multidrug efflux system)